jgi:hypothetical protein
LNHTVGCALPGVISAEQEKTSPEMGRFLRFLQTVTLFKAIHTAAAVDKLLLAREKRVALAADFNGQLIYRRAGRKGFTASAANRGLAVLRMDILLHALHSL